METAEELKICEFGARRDVAFAHTVPGFERVLHVFDAHWHGIRSASGCCPGHKLAISHRTGLDGEAFRHIVGLIFRHGIERVVYQGYSWVADELSHVLRREFGGAVRQFAITHVTSSQFENHFEMDMQAALIAGLRRGVLSGLASVKPQFRSVVPEYYPHTIVNFAPRVAKERRPVAFDPQAVFVPLENSWRKILYTNLLAAHALPEVERIYAVNWPTGLDKMMALEKLRIVPFRSGLDLYAFMGSMGALMNVSLAECQPMTQLEAWAMGTPCLTGPLRLEEFEGDPLIAASEVEVLDNPHYIRVALERLLALRREDPDALAQMIDAHLAARTTLAAERYADFLEL